MPKFLRVNIKNGDRYHPAIINIERIEMIREDPYGITKLVWTDGQSTELTDDITDVMVRLANLANN